MLGRAVFLYTRWDLLFGEGVSQTLGVPGEVRTPDPMIKSHVLYRLSYRHIYPFLVRTDKLPFPLVYTRGRRRYGVFFVCQRYFSRLLVGSMPTPILYFNPSLVGKAIGLTRTSV